MSTAATAIPTTTTTSMSVVAGGVCRDVYERHRSRERIRLADEKAGRVRSSLIARASSPSGPRSARTPSWPLPPSVDGAVLRFDRGDQIAHGGRGIVIGARTLVPLVALGQYGRALRCRVPTHHVKVGVDSFSGTTVQLATLTFGVFRIHESRLILEMQDQPQLEAGVRDGKADPLSSARSIARSRFGCLWGHSTSNTHQHSSTSSS